MVWVLLGATGVLVGALLLAVRSFGQWTEQMFRTERSNQQILTELRRLRPLPPSPFDAHNNVATFVADDTKEESA